MKITCFQAFFSFAASPDPEKLKKPHEIFMSDALGTRKLAEKFGQGDLPVKEFTPGEVDDNVADISMMMSIGWVPMINILKDDV